MAKKSITITPKNIGMVLGRVAKIIKKSKDAKIIVTTIKERNFSKAMRALQLKKDSANDYSGIEGANILQKKELDGMPSIMIYDYTGHPCVAFYVGYKVLFAQQGIFIEPKSPLVKEPFISSIQCFSKK